ncbi:hypothetical protein PACTADRAFT_51769 [Pachysolen tannophilus NRRL Y-2460]|uniref:Histidine biosynthesis trifunctional protein n=1 Tax=Pachysolen tannophilus NRRL Y-2460 TaxID=669874 RepID=A0A1E4TN17_PACTA|nr:hypothetical protein PACTADRAFT_51769 [Pachysolen tannophilus NRRL Y-2460]
MTFPLLPVFQSLESLNGDSLSHVSIVNHFLVKLDDSNGIEHLKNIIKKLELVGKLSLDVSGKVSLFSSDQIIDVLNSGVNKVFISSKLALELLEVGIPASRIVLKLSSLSELEEFKAYQNIDISLPSSTPLGDLKILSGNGTRFVYVTYDHATKTELVNYTSIAASGLIPVINQEKLTNDSKNYPDLLNISEFLLCAIKTDRPDGLYTSLVVDKYDHSLGLVYSSKESIHEAIRTLTGVYQSRRHGLWYKGATSGATQKLLALDVDCDSDCLKFVVEQSGVGFCHLNQDSCFGNLSGLTQLEKTLFDRKQNAPEGSYTKRLFNDSTLLNAKIKEEAEELTEAKTKEEISWEAADLIYFALTKCIQNNVTISDIESNLKLKHLKVTRRRGDAKSKFLPAETKKEEVVDKNAKIVMKRVNVNKDSEELIQNSLKRPNQKTADIMKLVLPIVDAVKKGGDNALIEMTEKFDKVRLTSPILEAPFPPELMQVSDEIKQSIDLSIDNVKKFHEAQLQSETMDVETCPGVICSRFARPIENVGLYIPGGTAVLPSTSLMLGVPALVAGCKNIIFASPPRKDGTLTPEVIYVAHKVGAKCIVLAGGAQAVAAMAYGTESVPKCDKILGPGNQFVTAAKMYIQNDTTALCSIDMPAGPSEVLVIGDGKADPDFIASDLLSQAEHGVDSQVIFIAVNMTEKELDAVDNAVHEQAMALPRVDIVRKCISHSTTLLVDSYEQALELSNKYAPEHLILQIENAKSYVSKVDNAGSVFVGAYSPESCGDYSSGTNHTLPTYGYARQYSGVNTATFQKFITSQDVTPEGLKSIGKAVMCLAAVEGLDGHRNAVKIRMEKLGLL